MKFIGREQELKKIERVISSNGTNFSLIYGRRRVGKSELIKQALNEVPGTKIYYECKQVAEKNNVNGLTEVVSTALGFPKLGFEDIESVLKFLFETSKKEKIILVLDEYPYLRESIPGMDSILQSLIDGYKEEANLSLVLLGSYVEIMRSLTEHSNPLYGRVDLSMNLAPMDYYESSLFYPRFSPSDKVKIYSVFGGIPYYNRLIDDTKSVKENILDLIAAPGARLENEVEMYLNAEMGKIGNANETFEALAHGYSKFSDILSQSHVSSGPTLVDVLDKLIKMGVVSKVGPINHGENKKKIGYFISDNLSLFYYRYIFKYASQRNVMDPLVFYERYIEKDFEQQYVPRQFEAICKQYLIRENRKGHIEPMFEKIGKYYYDDPKRHRNGEFDVVTEDPNGYVFYEAKFRNGPFTEDMIEKEIEQVCLTGLSCYRYVFFSKSSFPALSRNDVSFIPLDNLYLE